MRKSCLLLAILSAAHLHAVRTETITQDAYGDFFAGELRNVSLNNRGALQPGPALNEVMVIEDASSIWSAVADKKGNLYIGTGKQGAVYKIKPGAKEPELVFKPDTIMTRALALDGKGNLFVGTSPDGAVYRIKPGGRPEVFFDPSEVYVWDMVFGKDGKLYVATGAEAKIYQLDPDYQLNDEATVYFSSDRTHFTRLTWDQDGALIAGSGPDAYLYRITGESEGEVLFSAGTDEIANVIAVGGDLYFSTWHKRSSGSKPPVNMAKLLAQFLGTNGDEEGAEPDPAAAPSFLLKLDPDGFVSPVWSPGGSNLQSMVADGEGGFLVGSDQSGRVYSVTNADEWALLNEAGRGGEVTAILTGAGPRNTRYVFTSNPAAIYEMSAIADENPAFTSEPLDASTVARWGRLRALGAPSKASDMKWETRSGNAKEPDETWSDWSELNDQVISSPAARYLQYRVTFSDNDAVVRGVTAYYGARNLAPLVSQINIIPAALNIVTNVSSNPKTINAKKLANPKETAEALAKPPTENQKVVVGDETGAVSAAWKALDPNGDRMRYAVALKMEDEDDWVTLADNLSEAAFSTSTRGLPDGYYAFKITASDRPSNQPGEAKSGYLISQPFLIDNTSPAVKLHDQKSKKKETVLTFTATDEWGVITEAEYRLDGGEPAGAIPTDLLFDATKEVFRLAFHRLEPGSHSIVFMAKDERGNQGIAKARFEAK